MIGRTGNAAAIAAAALAALALGGCTGGSGSVSGSGSISAAGGTGQSSAGSTPSANIITLPPATGSSTTTAAAAAQVGSTGGATQAGVPQCQTADLSAEANTVAGSAAAGHLTMNITVTNTSGHTCTIYGFPGLALEDKNQDIQHTAVTWQPTIPKTLITLANGATASSSAQFDKDLPVGSEPLTGPCEPASFYLLVTAPNNTTQLVAPIGDTGGAGITVCDFGALNVLAFVPGSTGPQE